MVMDTDDYVGVANEPDKDPVAIIPETLDQEADQLQDLPMANDRASPYPSPLQFPSLVSPPGLCRRLV